MLSSAGYKSVQLVVRVASPLANGTVITNGTYSVDSVETAPVGGASIGTTVTSVPVLTVSATVVPFPVAAGGPVLHSFPTRRSSDLGATGVVLADTVPANTTFVSA